MAGVNLYFVLEDVYGNLIQCLLIAVRNLRNLQGHIHAEYVLNRSFAAQSTLDYPAGLADLQGIR